MANLFPYLQVWVDHPLYPKEVYTNPLLFANLSSNWELAGDASDGELNTTCTIYCKEYPEHCGLASDHFATDLAVYNDTATEQSIAIHEPNTALLSFVLMFGTFMIAYGLKLFRNSHYFGRTVNWFSISDYIFTLKLK